MVILVILTTFEVWGPPGCHFRGSWGVQEVIFRGLRGPRGPGGHFGGVFGYQVHCLAPPLMSRDPVATLLGVLNWFTLCFDTL